MKLAIPLAAFLLATILPFAGYACPVEQARYRYTSSDGPASARFVSGTAGEGDGFRPMYLHIDFAKAGPKPGEHRNGHIKVKYRLSRDIGPHIDLILQDGPDNHPPPRQGRYPNDVTLEQVSELYAVSRTHQLIDVVPRRKEEAPVFLFLPSLSSALRFVDGVSVYAGMFEMVSCKK
ncbi:MAG: hypothetical protein WBW32_01525 [Luteibacter sp.]